MGRRRHSLIILLATISVLSASIVQAGARVVPPPVPGWTHNPPFADDFPQRNGVVLSGDNVVRSSPVIAEMDRNPGNGKEVAVGGDDGILYVYRSNGQLLWSKNVLPNDCYRSDGKPETNKLNSSPLVAEIFGDGVPYVIVGYGTVLPSNCDGGIIAYRATDGGLAWRFSLRGWAARQGYKEDFYGVISSPGAADTDGDGRMEIGFGGLDRNVYLLNADGSVRWYYEAADTVFSSPAFDNVDSDPQLELVIGTDISPNPDPNSHWKLSGGFVYAFDTQPRNPVRIGHDTGFIWQEFFDQAIYSSPVIADVLPSNPGREIMIGSSCSSDGGGKWIKILRLSDGDLLQTLNAPECIQSSAAVGDIDDDGQLEIVANVSGVDRAVDIRSRIVAWNPTDPNPFWSTEPRDPNGGNNNPYASDLMSPIIADLDGNGSLEVAAANFWSVAILEGKTGRQLTCENQDTCGDRPAVTGAETLYSTPAVGDINNDGALDLVIGGSHVLEPNGRGLLYAWTGFAGLLKSPNGGQPRYSAPWPMFRGNAQHTGVFVERRLLSSPNQITRLLGVGQSTTFPLVIGSAAGEPINYTVTESSDFVQVNPTTGTDRASVQVTLVAPSRSGTYTTSLTVQAPGYPSLTIPVTVYAANQVRNVLLPLVIR